MSKSIGALAGFFRKAFLLDRLARLRGPWRNRPKRSTVGRDSLALENLECRLVPAVNFSTSGNTILLKEADPLGMGSGDAGQGDGKDNLDLKVVSNQLWYQWTAPDRVGGSRSSGWSNTGWNVSAATGTYTIQIKVSSRPDPP